MKSPEVTIHRRVKVTDKRIGGAQPQGTNRHVCRFDQSTERWNRGKGYLEIIWRLENSMILDKNLNNYYYSYSIHNDS